MDLSAWCLAIAMYSEARGEPKLGQIAVAEVILTRAKRRNKDPCQIIYEPNQFSSIDKLVIKDSKTFTRIYSLATDLLKFPRTSVAKGAAYFHEITIDPPSWTKKMIATAIIGGHIFYVEKQFFEWKS